MMRAALPDALGAHATIGLPEERQLGAGYDIGIAKGSRESGLGLFGMEERLRKGLEGTPRP